MAGTIESYHYKIGVKFDALEQLAILCDCDHQNEEAIERVKIAYNDGVSGILASYYAENLSNSNISATTDKYMKFVLSENIIERLDSILQSITNSAKYCPSLLWDASQSDMSRSSDMSRISDASRSSEFKSDAKLNKKYEKHIASLLWNESIPQSDHNELEILADELQCSLDVDPQERKESESSFGLVQKKEPIGTNKQTQMSSQIKRYQDQIVILETKKLKINVCNLCGSTMTMRSDTSELVCDAPECGQLIAVHGIVFEDSQIYTQQQQQSSNSKTKKYDPNGHLSKWIEKILAQEEYNFSPTVIDKIDKMAVTEYTRGGRLRPMHNIRCEKFREWMRTCKFTDCYDHAPLLRKIITGKHGTAVTPPSFTPEELQEILIDGSMAMREFEEVIKDPEVLRRLGKERVRNKFYYPYILWQVINLRIRDDRRLKLLECIHLQSDDTLRRNDIVWKEICARRNYTYQSANSNL